MSDDRSTWRASPDAVGTELEDGSVVLLQLGTKLYFTLNPTSALLWRALSDAPATAEQLSHALRAQFEVDAETAARDVQALLARLLAEGLVTRSAP